MTAGPAVAAVLFDLDGTLLDTAPDFCRLVNQLRAENGMAPVPLALIRPHVSNGSGKVIEAAFPDSSEAVLKSLQLRFLELYERTPVVDTRLFPGFDAVLDRFDELQLPWGVVTNKPKRFTEPVLEALGLRQRVASAISGDTLSVSKPHPLPLQTAAEQMGIEATACVYVGDAERDALAARGAGMRGIGVRFGYVPAPEIYGQWPFDDWIDSPSQLLEFLPSAR